jgi:hypothetical protein
MPVTVVFDQESHDELRSGPDDDLLGLLCSAWFLAPDSLWIKEEQGSTTMLLLIEVVCSGCSGPESLSANGN